MPYSKKSDLPEQVKDNLPDHALEIYKEAFNGAWNEYSRKEDRRGGRDREETAHRVAWSAVKQKYTKNENDNWVQK